MKVEHTSNPYSDFLEQPDIKYFSKSGPSKCLLALSKTLCDPVVLFRSKSLGNRHNKLTGEKNLDQLVSEVPSKMGY
jgi:hypothetical protein